jgi:hypothetical protein
MIVLKTRGNEERMIVAVDNEIWMLEGNPTRSYYLCTVKFWAADGFDIA